MGNRWAPHNKAITVEESLSLPIRAALAYDGRISWTLRGVTVGSVAYILRYGTARERIAAVLHYTLTPPAASRGSIATRWRSPPGPPRRESCSGSGAAR